MAGRPVGQIVRDSLRQDCWTNALYAFGTSHIFQRRARRLKRKLQLLNYAGIVLPLLIGAVVLSFGIELAILPGLIVVCALLLIAQLAISAWSMTAGWVDQHAYAIESVAANDSLARKYEELAKNPPADARFKIEYDLISADDQNRRQLDLRQQITAEELRRGMRVALHRFQRPCATCNTVPASLKPSNCDTCGNFS